MEFLPILSAIEKAAQDGLREVARETLKLSRRKSPRNEGQLAKEGRVTVVDLTSQVSYDSVNALVQHENLDFHHDVGEAKFLETAAQEVDVAGIMARRAEKLGDA